MKNLKNALLLKQLYLLKQLGYNYTSVSMFKEDDSFLQLPNTLDNLKKQAKDCHLCQLSKSRTKVVFGSGNENADIMFVGEAPSSTEDSTGKAFDGRSGEMLTKMVENVLKISREDIYVTNIVKCKPSNNSKPNATQAHTCQAYLQKEIELIKPKIIVALGEIAYHYLSGDDSELSKIRGILHKNNKYTLIATYHPSHLLRNPSDKKLVLEDLNTIKTLL
jgi:DNA polymerase